MLLHYRNLSDNTIFLCCQFYIVRAIRVQYHYNTSNCERSMKLATNVFQHILNFFERLSHSHMSRECSRQHFLGIFFMQNPKYYMSIERYFCVDSKEGLPHIKKIIPSIAIAILRPNDDAIKKFRKILLLLI